MAWPTSGDKASTTHLDAGTDDPGLARPEIKKNVDNVNSIIDEFGDVAITSPTNEQLLQYNASNSRWENATVSTGGGSAGSIAYYQCSTAPATGSPKAGFTELADGDNIATLSGTNNVDITPVSGTYVVTAHGVRDNTNVNSNIPVLWRNTTTTTDYGSNRVDYYGSSFGTTFTANGTDNFAFYMNGATTSFTSGWILILTKIS